MREVKILILFTLSLFMTFACGSSSSDATAGKNANVVVKPDATTNAASPAANSAETSQLDGKQLYTESCMICHRNTGKGGPATIEGKKIKPADLTRDKLKSWDDARWVKEVEDGDPEEGMPAFKGKLKPEEIIAISAYIKSLP